MSKMALIVYQPEQEEGGCCFILHSVDWPTLGFLVVTTLLKRDVDKAYLGWCEQVIKKVGWRRQER